MSDRRENERVESTGSAERYANEYFVRETLDDYVQRWSSKFPDRIVVLDGEVTLSWRDLLTKSNSVARSLAALGLRRGDRVAVQLPNWHEFVVIYVGVARLGAVLVPIMPVYRDHEVRQVLVSSKAHAYIYPPSFRGIDYREVWEAVAGNAASVEFRVLVRGSDVQDGEIPFNDLLSAEGTIELGEGPTPADHHVLVYTSGTESKPKGCLHTWNSYAFTPRNQATMYGFGSDDIELVVSPVTHTTGLAAGVLKPMLAGGALCLMEAWDPYAALDLIDRCGCTQITGATPFLAMFLQAARERPGSGGTLRSFICGGAPIPPSLVERAGGELGVRVMAAYGQSESVLLTSTSLEDDELAASRSDGHPLPGVDLKVLGSDDESLPPGVVGEICYRSPGAMLRYWENPEALSRISLPEGWRRTGDLGRMEESGAVRVTGRIKELIIRGGTNISVREIEDLLRGHPAVQDVAVVGLPDEVLGERIGAAIVPVTGERPSFEELVSFLRDNCRVAKNKLPERVLLVEELPLNATGKVLRFELVAPIASQGVGAEE